MKISAGIRAFFNPATSLIKRRFHSIPFSILSILAVLLFAQSVWLTFHTAVHPIIKIVSLFTLLVVWGFWVFAP